MRSREHLRVADPSGEVAPSEPARVPEAEGILELALERARRGDPQAWARLYQDHFDALHRHVTYLVGDAHLADDLVQEVFARAVTSIANYDGRSTFLSWLRGIAINVVRMHWRSQARRRSAYDRFERAATDESRETPDQVHLQAKRAEALLIALESLPVNLREAFVLIDLQQRSTEDAAAELGLSPGNLRVRASRARTRVRDELRRMGWLSEEVEG